jgi:hypothetical protein
MGMLKKTTRAKLAAPAAILDRVFIMILLNYEMINYVPFFFQTSFG